jgi:chromosome segregation ATPase
MRLIMSMLLYALFPCDIFGANVLWRLKNLESLAGQRESILANNPNLEDTYRAWRWYQQHRDLFEEEIFGPPILTVSAKNPRYADAIETLIRGCNTAFVCQTQADYLKFSREVFGSRDYAGLGLASVTIKEFSGTRAPRVENHVRPYTTEQLAELGFEGVALDFIEGPGPVLNMLCHDASVHASPVSAKPFTPEQNQACEAVGLHTWIHGNTIMSVRRRYGSTVTQVSTFGQAKIYRTQQADPNRKSEIRRRISELTDNGNKIQAELVEIKEEHDALGVELSALRAKEAALDKEKNRKQKALADYNGLQAQLDTVEERLQAATLRGSEHKQEMEQLDKKLDQAVTERAQAAIEFAVCA